MHETVLILDDDTAILEGLGDYLEIAGFLVMTGKNGIEGLARMDEQRPDIIVCDIMMPEMDGYTFIERVRDNADWLSIPFVFLSAKGDPGDVQQGYVLGADHYIKKPFDPDELVNLLRAKLQRAKELHSVIKTETKLQSAPKRGAFDPGLRATLNLIENYMRVYQERKEHIDHGEADDIARVMQTSLSRFLKTLEDLTLYVYIQSGAASVEFQSLYQKVNLSMELQQLVEENWKWAGQRGVSLHHSFPGGLFMHGHVHYTREILKRLIDNAIKFGKRGGNVWIEAEKLDEMIQISIRDDGMGISKEELSKLFESFKGDDRVRIDLQGAGLGLAIAGKLVRLHGGEIQVESELDKGSIFRIWLPINLGEA